MKNPKTPRDLQNRDKFPKWAVMTTFPCVCCLLQDNLKLLHLRNKNDTDKDFLGKLTHLKLNDRYIDKIDKIEGCLNITALYLQNNLLGSIYNLESFPNLTHLYLQRNKINKIENLRALVNLRKIYLGYNEISVFEGFQNLKLLKEVHIEYQSLPLGESLYFEPHTVASLTNCLEVLNIAGNGLITLAPLKNLRRLKELTAEENHIGDLTEFCEVISTLPNMVRLNIAKNPVASLRAFWDSVIISANNLQYLDGKEVRGVTRQFVQGLLRARQLRNNASGKQGGGDQPRHPPADRKYVSFTDLMAASSNNDGEKNVPMRYPPWKLRETINAGEGAYIPRAFRSISRHQSAAPQDDIV